ncbi:MAG: hypothetical protein F9K35_01505 [Burkholderiaceae bacterium]|nr:MAG: hypothetical protein F9K35_01505 [Burkholderiaceae bacterium]
MKRQLPLLALILLPALALAGGEELSALKHQNQNLEIQADTCVLIARTAFVKLRSNSGTQEEEQELKKCVADGRDSARNSHAEVKAVFKKKKVPQELADWRLEWMAAFDATALQTGDNEAQYLRRTRDARGKVERATNKFEIAVE